MVIQCLLAQTLVKVAAIIIVQAILEMMVQEQHGTWEKQYSSKKVADLITVAVLAKLKYGLLIEWME